MTGCGDDGTAMTTFHEDLQQLLPDGDELLMLGVTGSTAYGLDHADSDVDRLGIYAVPTCLLYTSPSPRDATLSRMPSSA